MDSSDSEEEEDLVYWNDWSPSSNKSNTLTQNESSEEKFKFFVYHNKNEVLTCSSVVCDTSKFGNWIPPVNFPITSSNPNKVLQEDIKKHGRLKSSEHCKNVSLSVTQLGVCDVNEGNVWEKKLNLDWGERVELHDVSRFNDGDLVWGFVNVGLFGLIKLWTNEYGYICGSAEGKISKTGSLEVSFISITDAQLLRKMLSLSSAQWASLCETVQEKKSTLKFDVTQDCDLPGKTPLERLWFLVCKRRHFLQGQCMLVKLSGAVKCMRQFTVTPKLIVQDIRDMQGQPVD